jgi:hypothetical protein
MFFRFAQANVLPKRRGNIPMDAPGISYAILWHFLCIFYGISYGISHGFRCLIRDLLLYAERSAEVGEFN